MVVVIEEESAVSETTKNDKTGASALTSEGEEGSNPKVNKDAVEGFETASEGGDDDDRGAEDDDVEDRKGEQSLKDRDVPSNEPPFEDALDDDELKQRALAQANDVKAEGNALFKDGLYEEALMKYGDALQLAPDMPSSVELRSICHANRATCFLKLGKHQDTIKECSKALELNPTYMKALIRRAEAHAKLEQYEEAIADNKKILEIDPSNDQARRSIVRLEPLAREKMEKMKDEMIGKLKEMGNSLLGRFGMSVDNFKMVKDPNTGSTSIQYQG